MTRRIWLLICLMVIALSLAVAGFSSAVKARPADQEAIRQVIKKAAVLADNVYVRANEHKKAGTLAANRNTLKTEAQGDLRTVFTVDLANRLSKSWVDNQFENVLDGPDQIAHGVTRIDLLTVSITNDQAEVTAEVYKFLIDVIHRDGQKYHERLDGKSYYKVTLVRENGFWKISHLEKRPDIGFSKRTLTPANE